MGDAGVFGPADTPQEGCTLRAPGCSEACSGAGCQVASDLEIACGAPSVTSFDIVGVAPSASATYVALSTDFWTRAFRVDGGSGHEIDDLMFRAGKAPLLVAADAAGTIHWTRAVRDFEGALSPGDGAVHVFGSVGAWQREMIRPATDVNSFEPVPRALEIGPDSVPQVWLSTATGFSVARRNTSGDWTLSPETTKGDFTLDALGQPVIFDVRSDMSNKTVIDASVVAGNFTTIASGILNGYARTHAVPVAVPDAAPYAVAFMRPNAGISVAWPDGASVREREVPGTDAVVSICPALPTANPTCPADCVERGVGVEPTPYRYGGPSIHYALGRTNDGTVFLAYLLTHVDRTITYARFCTEACTDICSSGIREDRSTTELHVVRVVLDGSTPQEVLNLPLGHFSDGALEEPTVIARAFGSRVAVVVHGVQQKDPQADRWRAFPRMRVVTLETRSL